MRTLRVVFLLLVLVPLSRARAESPRTIELILDASGSMNAKLADGQTRIAAAQKAVESLVSQLAPDTQLAFRVYGSGSPKEKHDCNDTQLLVKFGPLSSGKAQVVAAAKSVAAQGYTPITKVITLAAADFPAGAAGERTIVLVSDGKETCEGDPCAAARALAASGVKLVIHTIGFSVDTAARYQLRCIAESTGGSYFDAESTAQIAQVLGQAAAAKAQAAAAQKQGNGYLEVQGADMMGHKVTDSVTGKEAGKVSSFQSKISLPAGIYEVTFGAAVWKSVVVRAGETTVLKPGILRVERASLSGHSILDSETGQKQGNVSSLASSATLMPGVYDVTFGEGLVWPAIRLNAGETTILKPGVLTVKNAALTGHAVRTAAGQKVGHITSLSASMPLPPGDYTVEIGGKQKAFTITEGADVTIDNK